MSRLSSPTAILMLLFCWSPTHYAFSGEPEAAGWQFNGKDLTGWKATRPGEEKAWTVEEGVLVGRHQAPKKNLFLYNETQLADFKFSCDVLLPNNARNSGIQFRSQPLPDGEMRGYQADIGAGWWGKLYEESGRGVLVKNDAEKFVKTGDWNHYEVVCVGPRTQMFLNGRKTVDLVDPEGAKEGVIAVQIHSGGDNEVRFRNLKVTPLNAIPPYAAAGSPPASWPVSKVAAPASKISWKKTKLDDLFRTEGCCVADFDNDGDMDIATGPVWYEQVQNADGTREWKQHAVIDKSIEFDPKRYSKSFMNFADDLDGDGWVDLIVVSFPGESTDWFRNPGKLEDGTLAGKWERHQMIGVTNNESPQYLDIDGDGKRELLAGIEEDVVAICTPGDTATAPWKKHHISAPKMPFARKFGHGLGVGDLNGDGINDVIMVDGWWEGGKEFLKADWPHHPAPFGEPAAHMYVYDFDGDGDADLLSSSAHKFGIWWHEQIRSSESSAEPEWKTHLIDTSFSQTHAVVLADINGDGIPDFVTGRRHWAHSGNDLGEDQPAVLYWFELTQKDGKPVWTRHQIDDDSGVGTQFEVADVNGDGLLDIIISNKRGTSLLEQVRSE